MTPTDARTLAIPPEIQTALRLANEQLIVISQTSSRLQDLLDAGFEHTPALVVALWDDQWSLGIVVTPHVHRIALPRTYQGASVVYAHNREDFDAIVDQVVQTLENV